MKFDEIVTSEAAKLHTNDDLYNFCTVFCRKRPKDELSRLVNSVLYNEIAYTFRQNQLDKTGYSHGVYYNALFDAANDAKNRMLNARDALIDYCYVHSVDYFAIFA